MTIESRLNLIHEWLTDTLKTSDYEFSPASSDASFRRYFRVVHQQKTLILMDAPPEHEELGPFIRIANLLADNKVNAPEIFAQSVDHGFFIVN